MEVDPTANEGGNSGNMFSSLLGQAGVSQAQDEEATAETSSFMKEIMASVPGIDEATSFGEVIKSLDEYNFSLIIFCVSLSVVVITKQADKRRNTK